MKMPIRWHEECLCNQEKHLEDLKRDALMAIDRVDKMVASIAFAKEQIAVAKKRGLEAYDQERLCVKRRCV